MSENVPSSFVWDLAAVGIGAFLGFLFGIVIEIQKRESEKRETRNSMITFIKAELEDTKNVLETGTKVNWTEKEYKIDFAVCSSAAYDNTVSAGNLALLKAETQIAVMNVYARMNQYNNLANHLTQFLGSVDSPSENGQRIIRRFEEMMNKESSAVLNDIPNALKLLNAQRGRKNFLQN